MESYLSYMKDNNIKNNLHDIVMKTRNHPILEEYLKIYLQTDEGKKEIDAQNNDGRTALILASLNSDSSIGTVKLLIENGANINLQNKYGKTALMFALQYRNMPIVKLLIKKGANVNLQDIDGWTALMFVLQFSNTDSLIETVKLLIDNGANVNLQTKYYGWTVLMHVCLHLHTYETMEIVKLLIESGANVNLQDTDGNTALIFASKYSNEANSIEILKLLLENI